MEWLRHLEASCVQQGCYAAQCDMSFSFSHTHGAKSLVNAIMMFLAYYVPRHLKITSDDEWREILAAIRTFHLFCVQRGYVNEDSVLMSSLYKLRCFKICEIPKRLTHLCQQKYWDSLEFTESRNESDGSSSTQNKIALDEEEYERYFGDEIAVNVVDVVSNGWVICSDTAPSGSCDRSVFLRLPPDTAKLGMKGMTLSCLLLGLRNGVWRPIKLDGSCVTNACPPDDLFY